MDHSRSFSHVEKIKNNLENRTLLIPKRPVRQSSAERVFKAKRELKPINLKFKVLARMIDIKTQSTDGLKSTKCYFDNKIKPP